MGEQAMEPMRVAVLCGGRSFERAVSLRSGAAVEDALRELGHEPELIDTGPDTSRQLAVGGFDCAFVALHGEGGEDGAIQDLLELLHIPYTGARAAPSRGAYDKSHTKRVLIAAGLPTPPFVSLAARALQEFGAADAVSEAVDGVGLPLVVKPSTGGSALGIRLVSDAGELPRALVTAMSYAPHVLLERFVDGRELSINVLGTESPRTLPAVRIRPRQAEWYDFESRYTHGQTEFACPTDDVSDAELAEAERVALASYAALDLSGFGRVDIILDSDGVPWVLELNSIPGLTDTSLLPLAARTAGLELADVVRELLVDALREAAAET